MVRSIAFVRLGTDCSMYATFQSHNQKVVQTSHGIFLSHLTDLDEATTHCRWRLLRSVDGGRTFETLYDSPPLVGNKPPCLESDERGDLLALCENGADPRNGLLLLRFRADRDFREPETHPVGPSGYGKFSMFYDRVSTTLFAWNHYGRLFLVDPQAGVTRFVDVVANVGPNAQTQYPHVFLDSDGLHHAWTTNHNERYLYWSIHYARSLTRGDTWLRLDGTPASLPIPTEADPITLGDEFEVHTWLTSMLARQGKVHLAYYARGPINREHYVRIDLGSGRVDRNVYPRWEGEQVSIGGLDGFFATRSEGPLVYVGWAGSNRIGALRSDDNGDTWHDLALSDPVPDSLYAVGGCREITPDGHVLGTFTSQRGPRGDPFFFEIQVD